MSTPVTAPEIVKPDTVKIEVNGVSMDVPKNSMIIEATDKAGISVPRFCYHSKLSIAANCRMCLVDVEKAPKPMPACATPVMDGMKVFTHSRRAIDAQHGVMEFLLINHPLDCPICDQGGECELQDQALGYGRSVSRFVEQKRVVADHDIGPLVQTDLTRCIQCTRCVRFLDEIAGSNELGMMNRGDRSSIGTSLQQGVDSELSGNVIDLCPVGALTNKPFRYSARAWELTAKASIGSHDGVGSSLWYHTRRGKVLRAVPKESESRNETWLSDRDRYAHFGLNAADRVLEPMVKKDGSWQKVTWEEGIQAAADALQSVISANGGEQLGVLMSADAATEDFYLARKLADKLGSQNFDTRLKEQDFSDDGWTTETASFSAPMSDIDNADGILLVGSNIRQEAPLLAQRVRKAWRRGAKIAAINPVDWNLNFTLSAGLITPPQNMVADLVLLAQAVADVTGNDLPKTLQPVKNDQKPGDQHKAIAEMLKASERTSVLLGQAALAHTHAAWLRQLSAWICNATGAALNIVTHGGNATGAAKIQTLSSGGLNARAMLNASLKAYLLWDVEPDFDFANPSLASKVLEAADKVVAVSCFAGADLKACADVILPLAPLPESEGTFYTFDGQKMEIQAAAKLSGEARPGWKILRRLGAQLELDGFQQIDLAGIREEMSVVLDHSSSEPQTHKLAAVESFSGLSRVGEIGMYSVNGLCRRSEYLQQTAQAQLNFVGLSENDAARLGLGEGQKAKVGQRDHTVSLPVRICSELPEGAVWVKAGTPAVSSLGDSYGPIRVEAV